uniref:Uncharacterized protein n=1 Tax=Arundo donax TaxID=35708 RepID=A0A0A9C9U8_ARUDO
MPGFLGTEKQVSYVWIQVATCILSSSQNKKLRNVYLRQAPYFIQELLPASLSVY